MNMGLFAGPQDPDPQSYIEGAVKYSFVIEDTPADLRPNELRVV